jgi:hypothetical protein
LSYKKEEEERKMVWNEQKGMPIVVGTTSALSASCGVRWLTVGETVIGWAIKWRFGTESYINNLTLPPQGHRLHFQVRAPYMRVRALGSGTFFVR